MANPSSNDKNPTHRESRPDLSPTPPLPGSGPTIRRIDQADAAASLIMLVAMTMSSAAVLWSTRGTGFARPYGFVGLAGVAWLLFIVGLFAIWEERFRMGRSRDLFAAGAAVLTVAGFLYLDRVSLIRVLLADWVPALMALFAAFRSGQAQDSARTPLPH